MASNKKLITLVILSLLLIKVKLSTSQRVGVVMGKGTKKWWSFLNLITVHLRNDLGSGLYLYYSCHTNSYKYPFHREIGAGHKTIFATFRQSFLGRTTYFCEFSFGGVTRRFDLYKESRDNLKDFHCVNCVWSIRRNGPCALNSQTGRFDICYAWNR
ncbi:putative S-protein [Cardamine amara subsp. amara]|uniref:S-protein n=1 Tax=Cardamine amara subsp. amara TaxID=228776 RepID=A0ABD1ASY7_CARAN